MMTDRPLPSRGEFASCRDKWLREKGERDQVLLGFESHLWCYKGKVYDLTSYISRHPGGHDWLALTCGHDVTELVETHHLNEAKVEEVLRKFYVKDAERPNANKRFLWPEDGMYKTMKRRAAQVLKDQAHGPTAFVQAVYSIILGGWIASFLAAAVSGSWRLLVVAALFLHPLVGIGHNSMHQGVCTWKYCLDLTLFSHRDWQVSHCLSHHTYTNMLLDFEMAALEPFIYSIATGPRNGPTFFLGLPLALLTTSMFEGGVRALAILSGKRRLSWENLLPVAQLSLLVAWQGVHKGLAMWLVMHAMSSFLMTLVVLPLHHSTHNYTEGMGPPSTDFAVHTLRTSKDFSTDTGLVPSLLFFQLFNNHCLHHLFPAIDESRLHQLHDVFLTTCAEFKVPYRVYAWSDLFTTSLHAWFCGRGVVPSQKVE